MLQCKKSNANNDNIIYLFRYSPVPNNLGGDNKGVGIFANILLTEGW